MRAGGEPSNSPADRAAATRPPLRGCDHGTLPSCSPGANCLTGKTPRSPSTPSHKNIPLYRNSDLAYLSPIPAQQRGGRTSSRTRAGVRWTRAALKAGLCVQGEMNLVSMARTASTDGAQTSRSLWRSRAMSCEAWAKQGQPAYGETVWSWPSLLRSSLCEGVSASTGAVPCISRG
jgi:hypothetical protein